MNLLISISPGNLQCAKLIEETTQVRTKLCTDLSQAADAARNGEFSLIVFDHAGVGDPSCAMQLYRQAPLALLVDINSGLMSDKRIAAEIRGAVARLEREKKLAVLRAEMSVRSAFKGETTGILVSTQLALKVSDSPAFVREKLQDIHQLANRMKSQIEIVQ
jgi:hypothetical protein